MYYIFDTEAKIRGRVNWRQFFNEHAERIDIMEDIINRAEVYFIVNRDIKRGGKFIRTGNDNFGRIEFGSRYQYTEGRILLVISDTYGAISKRIQEVGRRYMRKIYAEDYDLIFQTDIIIKLIDELFIEEELAERLNFLQEKLEELPPDDAELDSLWDKCINSDANYDFELDESEIFDRNDTHMENQGGWFFFKFDELVKLKVYNIEDLEN